jgi:TP901 family phage tail tape measure protein
MAVPGRKFVINLFADSKPAEKAFDNVGKAAGRLPGPVGIATAAIAASFLAVVAVVGKVTKEMFDLGEVFNDSFRTIRVGTGATGAAFAELQDSFRNVAKEVPNDLGDVATAIAELNTRTGATGGDLEDLALQFLTVSRLLGGDVKSNIRSVTRLFGDFGVAGEDQADVMNVLFRASQMSGAAFDTLADQTVQYGASLRNLGFTLPESIALLASFERNGTNLETVMSGLRTAQAKLAESGKPLSVALADVIRDIQNAETAAEGTTLAMEIFGRRSGPDLYDAIQSGRLGVDELVEVIVNGSDTINAAAEDTDGFREAWENFKNYIKITLEPAATAVFQGLSELVGELRPAADRVVEAFERDGLQGALEQLSIEWNKIYEEQIKPLWERFTAFLNDVVKPLAIQIGYEIGAGIAEAIWSGFKNLVRSKLWSDEISDAVQGIDTGRAARDAVGIPEFVAPPTFTVPSPGRVPAPPSIAPRRLTMFAEGGIVLGPTLGMVGEAGPEAVIPLDRFERGMGGGDIYITVNGALDSEGVARQIERVLRDSRRRTGGVLV